MSKPNGVTVKDGIKLAGQISALSLQGLHFNNKKPVQGVEHEAFSVEDPINHSLAA